MKGAEFHRNNFSGNHVVEGGECYLVRTSRCFIMLLTKICSIHFAMMHVSETGR